MYAILLPLLPLLTTLLVALSDDRSRRARAQFGAIPVGAAFCGAIAALYVVTTQGPINLRFYNPASLASLTFPIGFYIDRLSAVRSGRSGISSTKYTSTRSLRNKMKPFQAP